MSRIAIIDTAIDPKHIGGRHVELIDLCGGDSIGDYQGISHGTMCAMARDRCASNYELINIRIFESNGAKVFGEIGKLAEALGMCRGLNIDVVSLSAVSSGIRGIWTG